jgi:hypothetical protein
VRYVVFAAALVFVAGLAVLTAFYLANNGITVVGVLGLGVLIVCGVGVIGSLLHPPRK